MIDSARIRNFALIAHIDHGKSTLADRFLELTGTVSGRQMKAQLLDQLALERQKGITIKLAPVTLSYKGFLLNLIDTPGHADFSYEVSKSLQACEGVILIVDASQGVQAQTLANLYLALENDLRIIPVLNKIDLPGADLVGNQAALESLLTDGKNPQLAVYPVSAKTGQGVGQLLDVIIDQLPAPEGSAGQALKALVFDSHYDDYRGVILYIRLLEGCLAAKDSLLLMASQTKVQALEVGYLSPGLTSQTQLGPGQIGYVVTNLKSLAQARVGDTLTEADRPTGRALAGYLPAQSFVFVGLFPAEVNDYNSLKTALAKLALADGALLIEPDNSPVLGHGWRLGLLGLLHLEIIIERLRLEYQLEVITSNPSASYRILLTNGQTLIIKNASNLPDFSRVKEIAELWVGGEIVSQKQTLGAVLALISQARGVQTSLDYVGRLVVVNFQAPLANLLTDFYDQLKSSTSGYGSLNYQVDGYRPADLVRLDFLIAGDLIPALSLICHQSEAEGRGRTIIERLKQIIPRQQFKVSLQAAIGGKIIARTDLAGFRKDVTAKLYGGDVSRRKKLLEQQKKGKAKMKRFGKVDLPPAVFRVLLERDQ